MTVVPLEQVVDVALDATSDSRPCMKRIAKLLGLDAEATEEQIVEALEARPDLSKVLEPLGLELKDDASEEDIVAAVKAKAEEKTDEEDPEVSLEDRAKAEGKTVISASDLADLKADAKAGREAKDALHQARFERAFAKALDEVRVDAKDETRKRWEKLYKADADATIEALEALPKLANTKAKGKGGEVPEGEDAERSALDRRVKARMREKDEDYVTALDAVLVADEAGDEGDED